MQILIFFRMPEKLDKHINCMVPESSLQLKMLIYNNYESINLQKKLWDKFYINAPELRTTIRLRVYSNYQR